MNELNLDNVKSFIEEQIWPRFHDKKLKKVLAINLDDLIKRKNPYLFRAKNPTSAGQFIKSILDASLSSGEETTFGNFMEEVALYVCANVFGGRKSGINGIDLEFEKDEVKFLVSIKSGPNWGNAAQIKQMVSNFRSVQRTLRTSGGYRGTEVIFIEGCCYGTDANPNKGSHQNICGQDFWRLISGGSETLYRDLIEPLGHRAKEHNEKILVSADAKLNMLTAAFVQRFCDASGVIKWDELVEFNSGSAISRKLQTSHFRVEASNW